MNGYFKAFGGFLIVSILPLAIWAVWSLSLLSIQILITDILTSAFIIAINIIFFRD